jgi:hypothetical protein
LVFVGEAQGDLAQAVRQHRETRLRRATRRRRDR